MAKRLQYTPEAPPQNPDSAGMYIQAELYRIAELLGSVSELTPGVQHNAPERPRVSMLAYADGTNWDPGSGEGLYIYKTAGWTFIV